MSFTADRRLFIMPEERTLPRWVLEREKMAATFPGFRFYGSRINTGNITSVAGVLRPNGKRFGIRLLIPSRYPYELPKIQTVGWKIDSGCPHIYADDTLCVILPERWSSNMTLAFLVAKTALWLNKYQIWQKTGEWVGSDEHNNHGLLDELLDFLL